MTGSHIQRVAVTWQVFQLTGDPFMLGLLGLCRFVPILFFGIVGGVLADRGDRRRTLVLTQGILLLLAMIFAVLTITDTISLIAIYLLTALVSTVEGISNPTRQALLPVLVPRADLPPASTMTILGSHAASVTGPALGGVIIASLGVGAAYVIDALSFGAVIVAVLLMRSRPPSIPIKMSGISAAIEGLRFLRNTPVLLGVMVADFAATFFGVSTVLMPIFAEDILNAGPRGLGLLLAAPAAGAVVTALILSVSRLPDRAGFGIVASIVVYGLCLVGFGLSELLWLSLTLLAISGAADAVSMTLRHATRNLLTPDELRGRVAAAQRTMGMGGPQLGEFRAGVTASVVGAGSAVALGGIGTVLSALIVSVVIPAIPNYRFSSVVRSATGAETVQPQGTND
jgi:MFS family permease